MESSTSPVNEALEPPAKQSPPKRRHICRFCQKSFLRSEHLNRHVSSHENQRPHRCENCNSTFGRRDVLVRHNKKCGKTRKRVAQRHPPAKLTSPPCYETRHSQRTSPAPSPSRDIALPSEPHAPRPYLSSPTSPSGFTPRTSNHPSNPIDNSTSTISTSLSVEQNFDRSNVVYPLSPEHSSRHDLMDVSNQAPGNVPGVNSGRATYTSPLEFFDGMAESTPTNLELVPSSCDWSDFNCPDFMGLEDTLLREVSYDIFDTCLSDNLGTGIIGIDPQAQHLRPRLAQTTSQTGTPLSPIGESRQSLPKPNIRALGMGSRIFPDEFDRFQTQFNNGIALKLVGDFAFPRRSRFVRFLNAYFEYFDPHTPIVHRGTFRLADTPPALVFAMLAIGGIHISEHAHAAVAYEASCKLLAQHHLDRLSNQTNDVEVWPLQTTLLCTQFGAFSNNPAYQEQSQQLHSSVSAMLAVATERAASLHKQTTLSWQEWIFVETISRLACWTVTLSAMILAFDPSSPVVIVQRKCDLPIPSENHIWYSISAKDWELKTKAQSQTQKLSLWKLVEAVFRGEWITTQISPFGLLSMISMILIHICNRERISIGVFDGYDQTFTEKMEKSLSSWEKLWQLHPGAEQVPTNRSDPLLADCFALLGSSCYHLYLGPELQALKDIARDPCCRQPLPPCRPTASVLKAIHYAANSWLVRSKLGVLHLKRTAALEYGSHAMVTAYEGALILSWWLFYHESPHRVQGNPPLENLFEEIFAECEDQDISPPVSSDKITLPLHFYLHLLEIWVWTFTDVMGHRLRMFASILENRHLD